MFGSRNIRVLYKVVTKKTRDFLFSNKFREILFFLFFVFIASVFWLLNALNYEHEDDVMVKVGVVNLPDNYVLVSDNPQYINVRVKDKGIKLLNYMFRIDGSEVVVDMGKNVSGNGSMMFKTENLIKSNSVFSQEAKIVSCSPDTFVVNYASASAVKLPVVLKSDIRADRFHYIKGVRITPDSVTAYIPDVLRDKVTSVKTVKLGASEISDSVTMQVALEQNSKIKIVPQTVNVHYDLGIYVDYSMDVPVIAANFPEGYKLRTFPPTVKVYFQVGMDEIKNIRPEDFVIVLDYNELRDLKSDKTDIRVSSSPSNVRNIRVSPESVEFLIENQGGLW